MRVLACIAGLGRAPADAAGRLGCSAGQALTCACLGRQEDDGEVGKDDIGNEVVERDATGRWSRVRPRQRAAAVQGRCPYLCGGVKRFLRCEAPAQCGGALACCGAAAALLPPWAR